ncbi:MAG: DNA polymerase III subunit beta [Clostridia bacterium]|nr:DNA polymerase III subunit beta [Clostridia bacterium]
MKFNCLREVLLENLSIVLKAVSPKAAVAQLEGVYLHASSGMLTLIGNNTEIAIKARMEADIMEEGVGVLNAKTFFDMVRLMPEGLVTVEIMENLNTVIKSGSTKYEIVAMEAEPFPVVEDMNCEFSVKIKENKLKELIKKTLFSIGTQDTKITFTGALFEVKDNELTVVTLDGYRMAVRKEEIDPTGENRSFIIPGKSLNELLKILTDSQEETVIEFGHKKALVKIENYEFYTRLIDGEFFNYQQIIPKNAEIKVKVVTRDLVDALERASLLITADNKAPIRMTMTANQMKLNTVSRIGQAQDEISIEKDGADLEIGFNHKFVLDALKASETEEIMMDFSNHLSPCILRGTDRNDFIYMVLPVRLKD